MLIDTSYLGLKLQHPFIAGASPLGYHVDRIKRLEDAGCAAVVLHSLFEEQITRAQSGHVAHVSVFDRDFAEILSDFPGAEDYPLTPDAYAEHIYRAKRAVGIPVIGSLNGRTAESWLKFATTIEQAGADALELNMVRGGDRAERAGDRHREQACRYRLRAETFAEDSSRRESLAILHRARPRRPAARRGGSRWSAPFNRFYQPDIDITTMAVSPQAELSTSAELLLRLRWVAILHGRIRPSLALSGGVATPQDGIKAILAGADVVQLVSALLRHGPLVRSTRCGAASSSGWSGTR